jgi:hypothetical protein
MASLNESAEDLMPMTMELSMRSDSNLEKDAENIRRFHEVSPPDPPSHIVTQFLSTLKHMVEKSIQQQNTYSSFDNPLIRHHQSPRISSWQFTLARLAFVHTENVSQPLNAHQAWRYWLGSNSAAHKADSKEYTSAPGS